MNFPSSTKQTPSTLGQRIRLARRRAGLSQAALARRSKVTASAVAQWEHPVGTRPALERLASIAAITGVPLDWLLSGTPIARGGTPGLAAVEPPAVLFDVYAETLQEETLLTNFRLLSPKAREYFALLALEFSAHRRRGRIQRG